MGTNYYLRSNICECCERYDELHIGKSSAGWCFSLNTHPDHGIGSLSDWKVAFSVETNKIYDEYGAQITKAEMLDTITNRSNKFEMTFPNDWYSSYEIFLKKNSAIPGPNGLLRHKIDGRLCIAHGEGTWDYMQGEFF